MSRLATRQSRAVLGLVVAGAVAAALSPSTAWASSASSARTSGQARLAPVHDAACNPNPSEVDPATDTTSDIDGDDVNDVVVGLPLLSPRAGTSTNSGGGIEAELSSQGSQRLYDAAYGGTSITDHFGTAVATSDLNHDLCADVMVGAPGSVRTTGGSDVPGRVIILFGSTNGIQTGVSTTLMALTPAVDDQFGAAIAISREAGNGTSEIWVGAPGTTVGGVDAAGEVYQYLVSADGTVTLQQSLTEASGLIARVPRIQDYFGSVLSATGSGGVLVGVPHRSVDGHKEAGVVVNLWGDDPSGPATHVQVISQNTAGVPGVVESGDEFGAALSGLAVGVPGENVGRLVNAGSIQLLAPVGNTQVGELKGAAAYSEDSPGVPGKAALDDYFGFALADSTGVFCQSQSALLVGEPGKTIDRHAGAGAVVVMPNHVGGHCAGRLLHQSGALPGKAETADRLGQTLATVQGREGEDEDTVSTVDVGVPLEDVGSLKDAGVVDTVRPSRDGGDGSFGPAHGSVKGLQFGGVLSNGPAGTAN